MDKLKKYLTKLEELRGVGINNQEAIDKEKIYISKINYYYELVGGETSKEKIKRLKIEAQWYTKMKKKKKMEEKKQKMEEKKQKMEEKKVEAMRKKASQQETLAATKNSNKANAKAIKRVGQ